MPELNSLTTFHPGRVRRADRLSTSVAQRRLFSAIMAAALALSACSGPEIEPAPVDPNAKAEGERIKAERAATIAEQEQSAQEALDTEGDAAAAAGHGPTLDIDDDGKIKAGGQVLFDPTDGSFTDLDEYLEGLVRGMETRPLNPANPDGPQLAMGELVLHAADNAPTYSLLKAMERCGGKLIWKLRFTGDWPGGEAGIAVPLPTDVHDIDVPMEASIEGSQAEPVEDRIEVTMKVVEAGKKLEPGTGAPWNGRGRFEFDDTRVLQYAMGPKMTKSLAEVASNLKAIHAQSPDWKLVIDARTGTVYRDVVDLLNVGRAAGFEQVVFVGAYE